MSSPNENGAGQEGHAPRAVCWDVTQHAVLGELDSSRSAADACAALGWSTKHMWRAWLYSSREGDPVAVRMKFLHRHESWQRCAFMQRGRWSTEPRTVPLFGVECLEPGPVSVCIGAAWESPEAFMLRLEALQVRDWVPTIDAEESAQWLWHRPHWQKWKYRDAYKPKCKPNPVAFLQAPGVSDAFTDWTPLAGRTIHFIPHLSHEARAVMERVWLLLKGLGCTLKGGPA